MSADDQQTNIDDLLLENRKFPPSAAFKKNSLAVGTHLYDQAAADDEGFWAQQAADLIDWDQDWHTICEWNVPYAKWFVGGKLNVSYNCLDRHVIAGRGDKVAFLLCYAYLTTIRKVSIFKIVNISAGKLCSTGIKLVAFGGKTNTTKSLLDTNLTDDGRTRFIKFCDMNFMWAIACMKDCKVFATGVDHHVNGKITKRDLLACRF